MMFTSVLLAWASLAQAPAERPSPPPPAAAPAPQVRERKEPRDDQGPPVLGRDEVEQADGTPKDLPPLSSRQEVSLASVDQDTTGRTRVDLAGLVGSGEGFAVLVSDERDGTRGYLVQRLDRELEPISEPERLDPRASGKGQWDGSFATVSTGRLGAVWLDVGDRSRSVRGRWWDPAGVARPSTWSVPLPAGGAAVSASGEPPPGPRPALLWSETACVLAWNTRGRVLLCDLDPASGELRASQLLGSRLQLATSGPRLASDAGGALACAFDAAGGIAVHLRLGPDQNAFADSGPGKLCGLAADLSGGAGWWMVLRKQGRLLLRHLERGGSTDRPDVVLFDQPWREADLAVGAEGPCVLVQPADGGLDALWPGNESSGRAVVRTEVRPAGSSVIAARVAFDGGRCAFLWTERHVPRVDVLACTSAYDAVGLTTVRKLFGGDGSAVQDQPAAAFAGSLGAVAWSDFRFGDPVIGLRGITADCAMGNGELFLPAESGTTSEVTANSEGRAVALGKRPAIALSPSGRGLVAWVGAGASGASVFAQAIEVAADGRLRARSAALIVEPDPFPVPTTFAPSIVALRGDRGFALAWVRVPPETGEKKATAPESGRTELRLARLDLDGRSQLGPETVATAVRIAHPALAQLDDGRLVLAWETEPRARARRLAARVFSERFEPELRELFFETMWRESDHSPAIAPAERGFALAWTSGEDLDSDVFARVYDSDGRPLSRPMALSTRMGGQKLPSLARSSDGSFVAVWQDDLSTSTRLVARRFHSKASRLGPLVRIAFGPEARPPDFAAPRLASFNDGRLLLVGSHVVPGKGREIGLCLLRPGWDHVEGR